MPKTYTLCAVHGESGARAACSLSAEVRRHWREAVKRRGNRNLILASILANEPEHTAVCADAGDEEHLKVVRSCLKSAIRSGKLKRTKKLKERMKP